MIEYYIINHEFLKATLSYDQRLCCVNNKIREINDYIICGENKLCFIGIDILNAEILNLLYDNLDCILNNLKYKYHPFNTLILILDQLNYELRVGKNKRFLVTGKKSREFNDLYSIINYYYNELYENVHHVICRIWGVTSEYVMSIKEQLLEMNLNEIYQRVKMDDKFIMLESIDGVYLLTNYKRLKILKDTDFNDLCQLSLKNK